MTVVDVLCVVFAVAVVLAVGFLIAGALDAAIIRSQGGHRGYDPRRTPKTMFPPVLMTEDPSRPEACGGPCRDEGDWE